MNAILNALFFNHACGYMPPKPARLVEPTDVSKAVGHYAADIGCTNDNIIGAINYGLRVGANTLDAVKQGKARARCLLAMQPKEVA